MTALSLIFTKLIFPCLQRCILKTSVAQPAWNHLRHKKKKKKVERDFVPDPVDPDVSAYFQATSAATSETLREPAVAGDCVASPNTCLNRTFNVNCVCRAAALPHSPTHPGLFWNRSGESVFSLGLEKQIRPAGWGPAGGWEAGGGWTPEVDAAGLPLPRTPHPDNGPPCSHSDRGWSEGKGKGREVEAGGGNTARINCYAYFSSLVIVGAANQLVMFFKRRIKSREAVLVLSPTPHRLLSLLSFGHRLVEAPVFYPLF